MHRFTRPPKAPGFDEAMQAFRQQVMRRITGKPAPSPKPNARRSKPKTGPAAKASGGKKPEKKSDWCGEPWKKYKTHFAQAQWEKCGFCEGYVIAGQDGDVEHYHPKSEIWALPADGSGGGVQTPFSASVRGRKHVVVSPAGYWWLAFDWDNYLLACKNCNQKWKGAYFPVLDDPRRVPPDEAVVEQPLLLNPFSGERPVDHLEFTADGRVQPRVARGSKSRHGIETIRICGLHRDALARARKEKANKAHYLVQQFLADPGPERSAELVRDLLELGNEEYVHCGMVRCIFEQQTGVSWAELERRAGS